MNILFKREQTSGRVLKVMFKLWCKLELTETEQAVVKRYKFDNAILISEIQPKLLRNSTLLGLFAGIVAFVVLDIIFPQSFAQFLALLAAGGAGYWYFHNNRETIYVKDLLHGRNFACDTVIDLVKQEGRLSDMSYLFRQVMESAKHWDDVQSSEIEVLSNDEAKLIIRRFL